MFDFDDDALDALGPVNPYEGKEPVLICWYSGGFYHDDGCKLYNAYLKAAAESGIGDYMILGFPDHYGFCEEGYEHWPKYVDRLVYEIDSIDEYKERPLLLVGHSRGACPAMSLATALGERVLKVYIAACGSFPPGKPTPWEELSKAFKGSGDKGLLTWFSSLQPDNVILSRAAALSEDEIPAALAESKWLAKTVRLMQMQYRDATFPDMREGEDNPIKVISAPIMACVPKNDASSPLSAMEGYHKATTGGAEIKVFKAAHMDILDAKDFIAYTIKDMLTFFPKTTAED